MNKNKLIIICLSIIILVSVGLNFLFFRSRNYYLQLNSLQLNPLAIKYYPIDTNPKEAKNLNQKKLYFFLEILVPVVGIHLKVLMILILLIEEFMGKLQGKF
ncbi:hypothetical protein D5R40_13950 [Okeania hirsuta]|uniref:Uncharacterized protein n=1 Tax=Okeania hirsuta TaxID=1458930 RepID=A0A3N6NXF2_9CYAN|nr:hypothetical protein D4Z78_18375 [Okeania hirsuta]RQH42990.1 hypothetical protein D5R40_13950 [Okeania hirsuta]